MNALCGILGQPNPGAVRAMAAALKHRANLRHLVKDDTFTVAAPGPQDTTCFIDGVVRGADDRPLTPEEVLHQCREARDPGALRFRGVFAAVVRVGASWWLLRDRVGVKPLYYASAGGATLFASEMKALLASGLVPRRLNLAAVDRYLTVRCVPGPESIIQGVTRVQPGHAVVCEKDGAVREVSWAPAAEAPRHRSREAAAAALDGLLRKAVNQTRADTLLWSAGLDCALLAALKPGAKAFFVTLKSAWQDEAWRARESARLLGIPLEKTRCARLTESMFAKVAYHLDEPVADASVLPLWLIAEQAAAHAPAGSGRRLMSGHGADEVLGGYSRYHFLEKAHGAQRLVPVNLLSGLLPALPPNAFVRRAGRYLSSIRDQRDAWPSLLEVFDAAEREDLYTDTMKAALHERGGVVPVLEPDSARGGLPRGLHALDLVVGLPDLLLLECDRLMAAHGVTLEFPYLQDDVVDFAKALPPELKYGVRSKPLLRQVAKGVLPGRVRLRARRGFRVPQGGPALRVIDNAARDIITQERVDASGLFKWPFVEQVFLSRSHNIYRRRQFWALLMFFAWYREFMEA